jgi:DNA ligase 1
MSKTFPTLYQKDNTGAIRYWKVWSEDNKITYEHGQLGTSNPIQDSKTVKAGKNLGKKNATTVEQQADNEAQSKWNKKKDREAYSEDLDAVKAGKATPPAPAPMLAQVYVLKKHNYQRFYVQPKFDGYRCIGRRVMESTVLTSRTFTVFQSVPHINRQINNILRHFPDLVPDGELYNHDLRLKYGQEGFNKISSIFRKEDQIDEEQIGRFHWYDIITPGVPFNERDKAIEEILNKYPQTHIIKVPTYLIAAEELDDYYTKFLDEGYEGLMIRTTHGHYRGGYRSPDLVKVKPEMDEEFEVIRIEEGEGKMAGKAMMVCRLANGGEVKAKMKCPDAQAQEIYENPDKYLGKLLTIKFKEYTADGSLREPRGIRFRDPNF